MPIHLLPPWWRPSCSRRPLAQRLHQLVEATERFDFGAFLGRQVLLGQLLQPIRRDLGGLQNLLGRDRLQAAEGMGKALVEPVEVALVLHHGGAGEVVEPVDVMGDETARQRRRESSGIPEARREYGRHGGFRKKGRNMRAG